VFGRVGSVVIIIPDLPLEFLCVVSQLSDWSNANSSADPEPRGGLPPRGGRVSPVRVSIHSSGCGGPEGGSLVTKGGGGGKRYGGLCGNEKIKQNKGREELKRKGYQKNRNNRGENTG